MRILQINSVCGIGSTGRIVKDIDNILKDLRHESYIAYGRESALNCGNAVRIGSNLDNYVHVALSRMFDRHGFGSKKATKKFINTISTFNPDVIHLHNIHGYYINIELLFQYLHEANKPVVWTLHDCWAFTGHCSYFDFINCEKWKKGCSKCSQKRAYPSSLVMDNSRIIFRKKKSLFTEINKMVIVTPSEWLANLVEESFLQEYPVQVINNGIDLDVFKPIENKFRERYHLKDRFVILGVANIWGKRKGYQYFLDLSKKLKRDEVIVLIGLTEKQKKSLPNNIIGIGKTNSTKELAGFYSTADVFINPTLEDNFPTTNLEALACGTPVITFDTGGSNECIGKNCGFVVEKGSLDGLLGNIAIVKKKGKISYSEYCINHAANHFDKRNKYGEYVELYKELLEK